MKTLAAKTKDVPSALAQLMKSGVRAERIAYEMDVAFSTVKAWANGTRRPKKASVMQIERLYGLKIL
jgi:DNA-binding transcriptional regulator YiaG